MYKHPLKYSLISFFLILLSICSRGYGEEPENEAPPYLMEEIVVTSSHHSSVSEVVVDKDQISSLRASSVSDILSTIPGASVTVGAKNSAEIKIRGFSPQEILVMVDGRPVLSTYLL